MKQIKKKAFLLALLLVLSLVPTVEIEAQEIPLEEDNYVIEGDKVRLKDTLEAEIEVWPHTLGSSGYFFFNITSKSYFGDSQVIIFCNDSKVKPKNLDRKVNGEWYSLIDEQYSDYGEDPWYNWNYMPNYYLGDFYGSYLQFFETKQSELFEFRVWMDVKPEYNVTKSKLHIGFMPKHLPIHKAIEYDNIWLLDPWIDNSYTHRVSHNITQADAAGTNYQMNITANSGAGANSGDQFYCNNNCDNFPYDIVFYSNDNSTLYDMWIESNTSSTAIIWFEIADNLTASDVKMWIYYGNAGASDSSDGEATFPFFDHFNDASIDTDKWEGDMGYAALSNSILNYSHTSGYVYISGKTNFGYNYTMRTRVNHNDSEGFTGFRDYPASPVDIIDNSQGAPNQIRTINDGAVTYVSPGWQEDVYTIWEFRRNSSVNVAYYEDGTELTGSPLSTNVATEALPPHFIVNNGIILSDWVLIRKYVDPSPTHDVWTSEEVSYITTFTLTGVTDNSNKKIATIASVDRMVGDFPFNITGDADINYDFDSPMYETSQKAFIWNSTNSTSGSQSDTYTPTSTATIATVYTLSGGPLVYGVMAVIVLGVLIAVYWGLHGGGKRR